MLTITPTDLRPLRITTGQCLTVSPAMMPPTTIADAAKLPLTPRQIEVLQYVAQGLQNKEIMRELGITRKTLEMHVANAMSALGARNRVAAAVKAVRAGWI